MPRARPFPSGSCHDERALRWSFQIEGDFGGLGDVGRTCLYRVVQEALTNCARHAEAKMIRIAMQGKKDAVSLSVQDDGVGFDTARGRTDLGLIGIEERVKELGGAAA